MSSGNRGGLQAEINVTPLIDVLLVLLIIFLVVMPIMLQKETLEIPREGDPATVDPVPSVTVFVKPDLSIEITDGVSELPVTIMAAELSTALRPQLAKLTGTKVVFVDFDPSVPWREAVDAVDRIRSVANDPDHDEIKVALKVKAQPDAQ
jgi:biopolymer transport protein TolR